MFELLEESFRLANLPATIVLIFVLFYWIIVLLGFIDFELFQPHLDIHADIAGDVELDTHADADVNATDFFNTVLQFFYIGELPITIIFSFFALFFWMGSVLSNHYLQNNSLMFAMLLFMANLILCLLVTKMVSAPFARLYRRLNTPETEITSDFSGSVCTIVVENSESRLGQAEINQNGDCLRINIKTSDGTPLKRGETGLVIEYKKTEGYYIVSPYQQN
jgi:hypothetical protein